MPGAERTRELPQLSPWSTAKAASGRYKTPVAKFIAWA